MEKYVVDEQIKIIPECCKGGKKCPEYVCYTLRSTVKPHRTYSGSTNFFVHRLRQHNGIIKGGARMTHTDRPWKIMSIVYGFLSKSNALRYEYFTKVKHSNTFKVKKAEGKDSIQRRAALLLTAELKMKPEQRKCLKYFVPDEYMAKCLEEARYEGVPGTLDAAFSSYCVIDTVGDLAMGSASIRVENSKTISGERDCMIFDLPKSMNASSSGISDSI